MNKTSALALVIAALALVSVLFVQRPQEGNGSKRETAYERVMRTRVLRCGYNLWEPNLMRDPNTGAMSGAFVDYMNEIGALTGLKIEWTAQLDWVTFPEDLRTGKADAMCAGVWSDSQRGTVVAWTRPVWYNTIEAYVRADDPRFPPGEDSLSKLNRPDLTFAIHDKTTTEKVFVKNFPDAKPFVLSPMASYDEELLSVATRKADVAVIDSGLARSMMRKNPEYRVRRYAPNEIVAVTAPSIAVEIHETELLNVLNIATQEAMLFGTIDRIAKRYDPDGTYFLLPARDYRETQAQR